MGINKASGNNLFASINKAAVKVINPVNKTGAVER